MKKIKAVVSTVDRGYRMRVPQDVVDALGLGGRDERHQIVWYVDGERGIAYAVSAKRALRSIEEMQKI